MEGGMAKLDDELLKAKEDVYVFLAGNNTIVPLNPLPPFPLFISKVPQ
jgi:hypothetical protein